MLATIAVKSQFLGANREINIGHHRTLPMAATGGIPDITIVPEPGPLPLPNPQSGVGTPGGPIVTFGIGN